MSISSNFKKQSKVILSLIIFTSNCDLLIYQVFDMTRLRGKTPADFEVVQPDVHYDEVGNSHNIVANEDTQYIYIVGATDNNYPNRCNGMWSFYRHFPTAFMLEVIYRVIYSSFDSISSGM